MNGNRYLFDTNAVIALLNGNSDLVKICDQAEFICVSIISKFEFLAFHDLTKSNKQLFFDFLETIKLLGISTDNHSLVERVIELRQQNALKLPDAIIAAQSILNKCKLVTADKQLISMLQNVISFNLDA
jgi:hypothetical protein